MVAEDKVDVIAKIATAFHQSKLVNAILTKSDSLPDTYEDLIRDSKLENVIVNTKDSG
jgi:hypothetical protein